MSLRQIIMDPGFNVSKIRDKITEKPELLKELDREAASTLLEKAVNDDLDIIELMFEQKVDAKPLELAIARSDIKSVEYLLNKGEKLADIKWDLYSLARCIYRKENRKNLLLLLFEHGLDIKSRTRFGQSLLHNLAMYFRKNDVEEDVLDIAEVLINSGISVNDTQDRDMTPLHLSCFTQNVRLASFFIKKGADVNYLDVNQRSPLNVAVEYGNNKNMVELLLSNGANINSRDSNGDTALHLACNCGRGNEEIISLLILRGADISALNEDDRTSFSYIDPYMNNYDKCLTTMVKEFAKLAFENVSIIECDMKSIQTNLKIRKHFKKCMTEVKRLSNTKFHDFHSYYSVLKMSINLKNLALLMKNEKFVKKCKNKISKFNNYESDLQKILDEAIQIRDNSLAVESRLKSIFEKYLPEVVIRILAKDLKVEDLPLK